MHLQSTRCEGSRKDDLLGCLGDINKTSAAWLPSWKAVHVHIALLVNLRIPRTDSFIPLPKPFMPQAHSLRWEAPPSDWRDLARTTADEERGLAAWRGYKRV